MVLILLLSVFYFCSWTDLCLHLCTHYIFPPYFSFSFFPHFRYSICVNRLGSLGFCCLSLQFLQIWRSISMNGFSPINPYTILQRTFHIEYYTSFPSLKCASWRLTTDFLFLLISFYRNLTLHLVFLIIYILLLQDIVILYFINLIF